MPAQRVTISVGRDRVGVGSTGNSRRATVAVTLLRAGRPATFIELLLVKVFYAIFVVDLKVIAIGATGELGARSRN